MQLKSWWRVVACITVLTLVACGDEAEVSDDPNGFDLGGEDMARDMASDPDQADPPDMADQPDEGIDLSRPDMEDMPEGPDLGPDSPPDMPDMPDEPDLAPPGSLEMVLAQAGWIGIIPIQAVGQGDVGAAARLDFSPDGTMSLYGEGTRNGKWQVLADGSIYLFELMPTGPNDAAQLILDVNKQGDVVRSLSVRGAPQFVFEQLELRSAVDFTVSDLVGRWQAAQGVPDDQGNTLYLAMRVDQQGLFEYGVTNQGNFAAFLTAPGTTSTLLDRRTFWYFVPPVPRANTVALAGQLLANPAGGVRMFVPFEYTSPQGVKTLLSVELSKVATFRP
jgi:hypothetical protein